MMEVLHVALCSVVLLSWVATPSVHTCEDTRNSVDDGLIETGEILLQKIKNSAALRRRNSVKPMDCSEVLQMRGDNSSSGVYQVWPRSRLFHKPLDVYCDMDDEGGAWTVIQRRGDFDSAKDYFYRNWRSYKEGFGDVHKDFWIGNDNIFALTNQRACTIKFTLSDWEGNATYAAYDDFWIDDEEHNYAMHVGGYRGIAGDSFSMTNGVPFSTRERDNDKDGDRNCAVLFKGAWWYTNCHASNLNGQYLKGSHKSHADGVEWSSFRGYNYSLKDVVIKIRPKDYRMPDKISSTPQ